MKLICEGELMEKQNNSLSLRTISSAADFMTAIQTLSAALAEAHTYAAQLVEEEVEAKGASREAIAKAILEAQKMRDHTNAQQRNAWADLQTLGEQQAAEVAELRRKLAFEYINSIKTMINAAQSVAASVREEARLAK